MTNFKQISKKMSYLLRHNPESLAMDKNGWIHVETLCEYLRIIKPEMDSIVYPKDGTKIRFEYSSDGKFVRASQGHSLGSIDVELEKKTPPDVLYHGTSQKAYKIIKNEGLSKMKRNHVHLSKDTNIAYEVGYRYSSSPAILVVDCEKMVEDGFDFYLAKNGVWLIDHVPPQYIDRWD